MHLFDPAQAGLVGKPARPVRLSPTTQNDVQQRLECQQRRRKTMPVELMDAIVAANTTTTNTSPNRFVAQEDAALVADAKAGDAHPFELLVQRHKGRIFSLAQRMTRNREDAEDVVQLSFQKAFIHLKKFEGQSLFSTWLTRIAINEALMLLRKRRGTREVPIAESNTEDETGLPLDIPDAGPNPEDSCLQREQEQILSAAVSELTPGMRKAIELRELGELSIGETAQAMGLSVGAVKARVFHGRRKLRKTLKHYVDSTRTYGNHALRRRKSVRDHSRAIFEFRPAC
jgi:RNA polymerase sigma-70 factor, ECF subfamily